MATAIALKRRTGLHFIEPMMPTLVERVPKGEEWQHEIKYDGYRTELAVDGDLTRAFTRRGFDWTNRYQRVVRAAASLRCERALLDGEMIVQDEQGRSDYHAFRRAVAVGAPEIIFMAFDLLGLDDRDLRRERLDERRKRLRDLIGDPSDGFPIRFSDNIIGDGTAFFNAADAMGLEGIVSKKRSSRYVSGQTKSWLKIKAFAEDEFTVIGTSKGDRAPVALLARKTDHGYDYVGAAMVTLADPERDLFWQANERLKTPKPALAMEPRKETSWLRPELNVRVRHLRGEEALRHATVQAVTRWPAPVESIGKAPSRPINEPTYPKPAMSADALLAYYAAVAPLVLRWVRDRPLNLFRCPDGKCFFQRNRNHPRAGDIFKEPIRRIPVQQKNGKVEEYLYVQDAAGVLSCVELEAVEFHAWGSHVADIERPDRIAIDLDPDIALDFGHVKRAALQVRSHLAAIGLECFALLTGGKGIHVVVPFAPEREWPEVRAFARQFCATVAELDPDRFTVSLPKAQRKGRIFLDYLRNQRTATAIMPYSARARLKLPVAAPIAWDELEHIHSADHFTIFDAPDLLKRAKSPKLHHWGEAKQRLPTLA